MAHTRATKPVPEEFFQDHPDRPLDPRPRAVRKPSSPLAFLAVVLVVLVVALAGSYLAYQYNGGLATKTAEHVTPPDIGTPVVRPSETSGAGVARQ